MDRYKRLYLYLIKVVVRSKQYFQGSVYEQGKGDNERKLAEGNERKRDFVESNGEKFF